MPKRIFRKIGSSKTYGWMNANPVIVTSAFVGLMLMAVLTIVVEVDDRNDQETAKIADCNQELISVFLSLMEQDAEFYRNAEKIFTQQAGEEVFTDTKSAIHDWNLLYKDLTKKNANLISARCHNFVEEELQETFSLTVSIRGPSVGLLGEETPNCATHNEWDNIQSFMYPWRVAEIIGNDGVFVDTGNPDNFARTYNLCWTENRGKVWFEQNSRLSYDKAII